MRDRAGPELWAAGAQGRGGRSAMDRDGGSLVRGRLRFWGLSGVGVVGAGVFLGALVLYVRTAAPSVLGADSGEFQFVPPVLGIAHPPGYPLYTLLGKLFSLLPLGDIAYRVNLMSGFLGAWAVGLVFASAVLAHARGTERRNRVVLGGVIAALAAGLAPTWWSQATVAAVRTLTGLIAVAAVVLLLAWWRERDFRWLLGASAVLGLGVFHHPSLGILVPAAAAFVVAAGGLGWLNPRRAGTLVAAFLATGIVELYLPIRSAMGAPFDVSRPTTLAKFWELVSAEGFRGDMFHYGWADLPERLEVVRQLLLLQFGIPVLALGGVGVVALAVRRWPACLLLGSVFLLNVVLALTYRAPVIADYLVPAYLMYAVFVGYGACVLLEAVERGASAVAGGRSGERGIWPGGVGAILPAGVGLAVIAALGWQGAGIWGSMDMSQSYEMERFGERALESAEKDSTILADWHRATALWYFQLVEGRRPDVRAIYVAPEGDTVPWLKRSEAELARGPTYLTHQVPQVAAKYRLMAVGPLLQVVDRPLFSAPAFDTPVQADLGGKVVLLGYNLPQENVEPGGTLHVTLFWQAVVPIERRYKVFVQLIGPDGQVWGQWDNEPMGGTYPTDRWQQGEVVADDYELMVLPGAAPGGYRLVAGMYEMPTPTTWHRLPVTGGPNGPPFGAVAQDDAVLLREVAVASAPPVAGTVQVPANDVFGGAVVWRGLNIVGVGEGTATVELLWEALGPADEFIVLVRARADGKVGPWQEPVKYDARRWQKAQWERRDHQVRLPDGAEGAVPRDIDIEVKVLDAAGKPLPVAGLWGLSTSESAVVAIADLPGRLASAIGVNFGNRAVLREYGLDRRELRPGEGLTVATRWLPLRRIDEDYSISVQLVDKQGKMWAQNDGVPVYGGFPTLRWVAGWEVVDTRRLSVGPEVPPGDYQLRVGVYPMGGGPRLPVLDMRRAKALEGDMISLTSISVLSKEGGP